jgi:hypothetical protein
VRKLLLFLERKGIEKKVATNVDFVRASMETLNQFGNKNIEINVKSTPTTKNILRDKVRLFNDIDK